MKNILKYLGILIMLVGVVILAFYHFGSYAGNGLLIAAGACVLVGLFAHIIINRYID